MLMKLVERGYLSDANLHIVIASICKRIIIDILLLGYILSCTYICQIYLSYICYYLSYPIGIVIISIITLNLRFEFLFLTQLSIFNSVFNSVPTRF